VDVTRLASAALTENPGETPKEEWKRLLSDPRPGRLRTAYSHYALGSLSEQRADYKKAAACARRAIDIVDAFLPGKESLSGRLILFRALSLLGTALRHLGAYSEAEAPLVRAIELSKTMPDRPELGAEAWNNLGVLCKYAGWFDRGAAAYAGALSFTERMVETPGRTMLFATVLHNMAGLDHARGCFGSAEEPARRAWFLRRELLGEEHPTALADAVAYAGVLDGLGRYAESRPIYERALAIYERVFGPEHLHNLAFVEYSEGNRLQGVALARRAYSIKTKLSGAQHPDTALSGMALASLLPPEDHAESSGLLGEALRIFESTLAPGHPHTARCRALLDGRATQRR